ncbi:MAG: aminotransferase class V-fold PLP-dependent enzyme [Nibricoccus sp.]
MVAEGAEGLEAVAGAFCRAVLCLGLGVGFVSNLNQFRMPYFDHNATTPLVPVAREAWLQASTELWQNPASPYRDAARVKIRFDALRSRLAEFIGCAADEIVFTSGATEGANAILAYWARIFPPNSRIAVSRSEHPCLLEAAKLNFGERIVWLDVTSEGMVKTDWLKSELSETMKSPAPILGVVLMAANNETGVLQPWAEIAALCRAARVSYLCDAAQWLGKLPAAGLGAADWLIASAHKFGGPKGVGFLRRPPGAEGFVAQVGGTQQRGHRAGTEDLPSAAAMVSALAEAEQKKVLLETERLRWRETFERDVCARISGARVIGAGAERLWNTVSLLMPHTENSRWVTRLDKAGFQVSTGSACATGKAGPSHVLTAQGMDAAEAKRVIRISASWETTHAEWNALATALVSLENEFRADKGTVVQL